MSVNKTRSEAAKKARATIHRRGNPPQFDMRTYEGRVLRQAYKAASAAITRATKSGIDVDEQWLLKSCELIAERGYLCDVTGMKFDVDFKTKGAGGTHLAPSPDRIDPGKGYVLGNVRWVLWAVNRAKGEMDDNLFIDICRAVIKNHDLSQSGKN